MKGLGGFTHLHLHSQYSLLDGAIRIDELCPEVLAHGMGAVALTDHGNMYGAIHFYKKAREHGIKPIFGCEAYITSGSRFDRSGRDSKHLVLLAKDEVGYKNLTYLISKGFTEGFYYNPRIDEALLAEHSQGLIGLSACLGGVINKPLLREGEAAAAAAAQRFAKLFAPGDFYIELQSNGLPEQDIANQACLEIARTYGLPLVATADAHYLRQTDATAHEMLMCIGLGKSLQEFRNGQAHSHQLFVLTPQQMWDRLGKLCPQALENTEKIAQSCQVDLHLGKTHLPNYDPPQGLSREDYLAQITFAGLKQRLQGRQVDTSVYKQRLEYELDVISRMGFAGYFLIVWDFIRFAREAGIPVGPGRGSGAGSLVAYSLRITDLDPLSYDLLFERFLNPERVSMPDFDIDFCQDRRGEVIEYVGKRYGSENVGQIITYSQLSAKSVIKDVGRVMQLPFAEVNALTKLIPNLINGKKVSIAQALALEPKLRSIQREKPIYGEVIRLAQALEGLNRQTGVHAAGVVIADAPLWHHVPVRLGKNGELITQFAKDEVEDAGLVKFDFLGLKTLTLIAKAQRYVRLRPGDGPLGSHQQFDIEKIPLDDAGVYQMLSQGDTDGVFQLESSGFKELLKRLKPDCFEDIIAAVALYRPGPLDAGMVDDYIGRKHGKRQVSYPHPLCEAILQPTYGVIVYQEQVMRIAVALCGFSMGQADILRKAMGKKKAEVMAQMRQEFVQGARSHGQMTQPLAEELFDQIEKFAGYAFNKSHSAAYALLSYQTAYLRHHYLVEFMTALMSCEIGNQDSVVHYIHSAKEKNIRILPPCVRQSERDFSVQQPGNSILFGLGAVKGIGDAAIETILQARKAGAFTSLQAFCEQTDTQKVGRKTLIALIKSGAFDCLDIAREVLLAQIDDAIDTANLLRKERQSGQATLFSWQQSTQAEPMFMATPAKPLPVVPAWSTRQRLACEKEALGFYVTGHPLDNYHHDLPRLCNANTQTLRAMWLKEQNQEVMLGGVITKVKERPLKNEQGRMANVQFEDLHGSCEIVVFSRVFAEYETLIKSEEPVLVRGHLFCDGDDENSTVKIRANTFEALNELRARSAKNLTLHVQTSEDMAGLVKNLGELCGRFRGPVPIDVRLSAEQFTATLRLGNKYWVRCDELLLGELGQLFGASNVRLNEPC